MGNRRLVMRVEEVVEQSLSALDVMPSPQATERALRDPQPGDQWTEMYSYWVHVSQRIGDRVLTHGFSPPCECDPAKAHETVWHKDLAAFRDYMRHITYNGNHRWIAEVGGSYDPNPGSTVAVTTDTDSKKRLLDGAGGGSTT